jgi:glycosyltransferase involved in cell wall biosynthesis
MKSPGKILILVENQPVPFDRRVWSEAIALREEGYEVSVICPTGGRSPRGYEQIEGVHIYRYELGETGVSFSAFIREYALAMLKTFALTFKVWRRHGFDVIQACNPPDLFFAIGLFYKLFRKKFMFDQHDISPEMYRAQKNGREGAVYKALLLMERLTYATSDAVITANESFAKLARGRGHVRPDKVFVVRNGPNLNRLKPVQPEPALKQGAAHMVCYVGLMGPQDGLDYALRVARWVVYEQNRRDVHFTFIGTGDILPALKSVAHDLELDDYVTFTGRISDDALLCRYLSTADVCITPDPKNGLNEHCTMIKTMEYMAMGKAQVAFDLDETRLSAGEAALYAEPNSIEDFGRKLISLLDDPEKREAMGRAGRQRIIDALSWEHARKDLLRAYRSVLPGKKPVPVASTEIGSKVAEI